MNQPNPPQSKLYIRSEVLAAIEAVNVLPNPSRMDKLKQLKRLQSLDNQASVVEILVKELQRSKSKSSLHIISELLMELGTIDSLKEPLWHVIQNQSNTDEVKDSANIILRHLGDATDPNVYLDYLDDPAGLINRETERMLEISAKNPAALIDFIDFIFSLPVQEQMNLIQSLKDDYPAEYTLNIFIPSLLAKPPEETMELLLKVLGETQSPRAAQFLQQHQVWFNSSPALAKLAKKAMNKLRLVGAYREDLNVEKPLPHVLLQSTKPYQAFATISDGIGNSAVIVSREHGNGELALMSVAISDIHGIIDCFGFYDLSKTDFQKLLDKLHEENTKIEVSVSYCVQKLIFAERLNHQNQFRVPYEYVCWKVMLDIPDGFDANSLPLVDTVQLTRDLVKEEWYDVTNRLYQHPDFSTWFLEEGDHPVVTSVLEKVLGVCAKTMAETTEDQKVLQLSQLETVFISTLDALADAMVHGLLNSEWRDVLAQRLADAAYLLGEQKTHTFSQLAATEANKLSGYKGVDSRLDGFIKHYGRRCVEEDLLRLKQDTFRVKSGDNTDLFDHLVDKVLANWEL